jgi:hypothetical protein
MGEADFERRDPVIYCSDCGRELPEDANFCLRCGKPLTEEALARVRSEPQWETGRIRCKVLKKERFSRNCSCVLVLEAIGPNGTYVADQSTQFDYYFGYDPRAHGSGFVFVNENRTTRAIFDTFVRKLVEAEWEPVPGHEIWYQCHFRRRLPSVASSIT